MSREISGPPLSPRDRMVEWTIESQKYYTDPFNEVDVDIVFSKGAQSWRVPAFWRGGQRWTVRFAPPAPGEYTYELLSSDSTNADLNGHPGRITIREYQGSNALLRHGPLRVSESKRYFEHTDATPFFWLGDTWWTGLSDRLSWEGFQTLAADRKAKGFTVVQIVAGLVPWEEEPPADPGFCNEGGPVWEGQFERINPKYFDHADRRIRHLIDAGLTPAIVGAWFRALRSMGIAKMKQHWRYLIARYGAYPVFWIVGGELFDPPDTVAKHVSVESLREFITPGWTEIARFVRSTDPYHHPMTAHEAAPPADFPLQDESLMDFDLVQSSHLGWPSIAAEISQVNRHYARTGTVKPIVEGEIGYEKFGATHLEDFQRTAFWLAMLNGAAGHTYGSDATFEAYSSDKPLHRVRWSFRTWEEGMHFPGSNQVGLGAKLLRQYEWWRFEPHPEWVTPRGTTMLEPREEISGFDLSYPDVWDIWKTFKSDPDRFNERLETDYPGGEWKARQGTFRRPYAAGIPKEVRVIYIPNTEIIQRLPPTVLGLEIGIRYRAYFWEPSTGTRFDLGEIERPQPGELLFKGRLPSVGSAVNLDRIVRRAGMLDGRRITFTLLKDAAESDAVASVTAPGGASAALVLRHRDEAHHVGAIYSAEEGALYLTKRQSGAEQTVLGRTLTRRLGDALTLRAEVRASKAVASLTDGKVTVTTPIVEIGEGGVGGIGIMHLNDAQVAAEVEFELRRGAGRANDEVPPRKLYDATGGYRGELIGPWQDFGRDKHILLDAYRPERLPASGDWVFVLSAKEAISAGSSGTLRSTRSAADHRPGI